ncbi:kinesin K39, (ISS) [Trypanosoma rangeli]|uniref:Kinesin K39, (ISS) n=1 Tax=Trypanosoma rangeli TaxID=5698 RepID=A0A422N9I2_TRYRA|nr:kinesin K39, (ISS) [Trypanosoma rangeli]RNF02148.1 kinesin K39, (ISS) [Trypanosoma rangeli]|eukprot:RNF02148.1 kinesin K39, (ISS) [Trypanosoma rangeli]
MVRRSGMGGETLPLPGLAGKRKPSGKRRQESHLSSRRKKRGYLLPRMEPPLQEAENDFDEANAPLATSLSPLVQARHYARLANGSTMFLRALSLSQSNMGLSEVLEGELWYVTSSTSLGRARSAAMQWVTCEDHRLTVFSSWSPQGRIIDTMHFDGVRVIFTFHHNHRHINSRRHAPMTRLTRCHENNPSMQLNIGNECGARQPKR